jgi:hypothetical protein
MNQERSIIMDLFQAFKMAADQPVVRVGERPPYSNPRYLLRIGHACKYENGEGEWMPVNMTQL